jgi:hypothetical protein
MYIFYEYTREIIVQIYLQKKKPYTRRFFAGGSLSTGGLDRLRDPDAGDGVAMRGERLGSCGLGAATTDGVGVASRGERRQSAGLGAGERERERLRDRRGGPGIAAESAGAIGTSKRLAALSPSCELRGVGPCTSIVGGGGAVEGGAAGVCVSSAGGIADGRPTSSPDGIVDPSAIGTSPF